MSCTALMRNLRLPRSAWTASTKVPSPHMSVTYLVHPSWATNWLACCVGIYDLYVCSTRVAAQGSSTGVCLLL